MSMSEFKKYRVKECENGYDDKKGIAIGMVCEDLEPSSSFPICRFRDDNVASNVSGKREWPMHRYQLEPIEDEIPEPAKQPDPVNAPAHYTQGGIECIDAIKAMLTPEEFRGYLKGNAMKYQWRERHKGNSQQDLAKAAWYLSRVPAAGEGK